MSGLWHLCRRGIPAEAESGVPCKVSCEDVPRRGEFAADEAEAHQPYFPCVDTALTLCRGIGELEEAEFDGAFRKGSVEIEAMVA